MSALGGTATPTPHLDNRASCLVDFRVLIDTRGDPMTPTATATIPAPTATPAYPVTVDEYEVTADEIKRVRVIVTQWDTDEFSVYAEYDYTAIPHTESFDPLIDTIDHLPTRAEVIDAFEEAHLARCEDAYESWLAS